jgi:hypothetical protein
MFFVTKIPESDSNRVPQTRFRFIPIIEFFFTGSDDAAR